MLPLLTMAAPERNAPCPCGSGKKYKKCCLGREATRAPAGGAPLQTALHYHRAGRLNEAERLYREILAGTPDQPQALHGLGLLAHQLGQHAPALELLNRALTSFAQHPVSSLREERAEAYNNLGIVYLSTGDPGRAMASFREAIHIRGDYAEAHYNLGTALLNLGRWDEAIPIFHSAIALKANYAEAYYNLGTVFGNQGELDRAIACFHKALSINPAYAEAYYNLGTAFMNQGSYDQAVASFKKALVLKPAYIEVHYNLGTLYLSLGAVEEAMSCFKQALALQPEFALAHLNLGNALLNQGRVNVAMESLLYARKLQPNLALAYDSRLLALNYLPESTPAAIYEEHRGYAARFEAPLRPSWPMHTNNRDPERRLKVGYVSADFRLHPVAYFLEPLLAHHDKRAVEVYCYYNHTLHDAVTERLIPLADDWIRCKALTDEQLAARIQADGIDILVDLAGHTAGNRLLVFARKPAPVQVTYLGYPATTGLSAIDYRLVTADTDPPGAEAWHSERLYRLPRSLWCYRPSPDMPAVIPTTAARRNGFITFGSMNNIAKVSEAALAAWSQLLQAVPGARLVMTNLPQGEARDVLVQRFAAHGIAAARLHPARQAAGGGVLRAAEHHRHRAGPVSVHGHHHHLRESVDGGAGGDADRRDERGALGVCVAQGHWIGRTGGGR